MNSPSVAVVILNWNGKKFLEQFLASVVKSRYENLQIYVIDNASTDDSVLYIGQNFPSVKIICNEKNFGFAGGYNEGLKKVEADYIVLLNQDVEVPENWIAPVIEMMEHDKTIAGAQPKIKMFADKNSFEYAGAAGGLMDKYFFPFCNGRVFDTLEKDEKQFEKISEIFWAGGACIFVRKKLFDECGGFDADLFAHMEEIDLCWRLKNRGHKIMYCPSAEVFHVGGGSLDKSKPFKTYLNFRNNLIIITKNYYGNNFYSVFVMKRLLDAIAAWRFLFRGEFRHFFAVLKGHFHFYMTMQKTLKKRKQLKAESVCSLNETGRINKSIVWQYYLRRRKKSQQIVSGIKTQVSR